MNKVLKYVGIILLVWGFFIWISISYLLLTEEIPIKDKNISLSQFTGIFLIVFTPLVVGAILSLHRKDE